MDTLSASLFSVAVILFLFEHYKMNKYNACIFSVVVCAPVGKEFPDMRQNERRTEFIRVGDAVRTVGRFKGELTPFVVSAMRETWIRSLGWEDPLEEGMATHFGILPKRISMGRGAQQATVHGVAKSRT